MPDQVYIEGIDDLLSLRQSDDAISAKKARHIRGSNEG